MSAGSDLETASVNRGGFFIATTRGALRFPLCRSDGPSRSLIVRIGAAEARGQEVGDLCRYGGGALLLVMLRDLQAVLSTVVESAALNFGFRHPCYLPQGSAWSDREVVADKGRPLFPTGRETFAEFWITITGRSCACIFLSKALKSWLFLNAAGLGFGRPSNWEDLTHVIGKHVAKCRGIAGQRTSLVPENS